MLYFVLVCHCSVILYRTQLEKIKYANKVSSVGNTGESISPEHFSPKLLVLFCVGFIFLIQIFNRVLVSSM